MGELIQFIPRPNPERMAELERQAAEIMNVALNYEPSTDTAPSEYVAPDGDCA